MAAFPPQLPPGAPSALPPPDAGGAPPAPQGPPGGGSPLGALADKGGSGGSLLQLILTFLAGMGGATLLDQLPKLMSKMAPRGAGKGQPPPGGAQIPPGQMPPQVAAQLAQLAQRGGA